MSFHIYKPHADVWGTVGHIQWHQCLGTQTVFIWVSWSAVFLSQIHLLCWQEVQCSCSGTVFLCHFVCCMELLLAFSYSTRKHGFPIDPVFYLPAPQENLGYLKQCWRTMFRQTYHFFIWTPKALATLRISKVLVLNSQFNDLKTLSLAHTGMKAKPWALGWRVPIQSKAWKSLVSTEVGCSWKSQCLKSCPPSQHT